jgi:hypothetical protein
MILQIATLKRSIAPLALLVAGAAGCDGSPIFGTLAPSTGTRTESANQITTGGSYATDSADLTISWMISQDAVDPSLFDYVYKLSGASSPAIGHLIISLGSGCSGDPACLSGISSLTFGSYTSTSNGGSNPGFPDSGSIDGVKINFGNTTYSFTSDRAPVYGDFYLKGGSNSFAYNAGLANASSESATDFIATPGLAGDPAPAVQDAPEPETTFLVGAGMIAVGLGRSWRKRSY